MIKLYGHGFKFGMHDPSGFVLKLDLYMRMQGIEFELIRDMSMRSKAPKRKLPFIDDDGHIVADSYFIIEYLKEKYGDPLDEWLNPEQKAQVHLVSKTFDEHIVFCQGYSRWRNKESWPLMEKYFFSDVAFWKRAIFRYWARRETETLLFYQGIGRHSEAEVEQITRHALQSVADMLGDKLWFMGDKPTTLDVVAYAFLAQSIVSEFDNKMTRIARSYDNLVAFCQRIHEQYYPEYQ